VPFDRSLIVTDQLSPAERDWLNAYHAEVQAKLAPRLSPGAAEWLTAACAPL
jgi:Xaa-Pro aminopeptidase